MDVIGREHQVLLWWKRRGLSPSIIKSFIFKWVEGRRLGRATRNPADAMK